MAAGLVVAGTLAGVSATAQAFVHEALAGLVHQFADPMACFRELVQNAVDAGSAEIDIRFEHDDGRLVIHVDDFGEGMDRSIIDTKLTRLFSSGKEGDRTKIGRFGIGFVSVFALDPEVICLDTSRSGEHWRVIFKPDRSFIRVARSEPVDGTKIAIYKTMTAHDAATFMKRAREVIAFWCRHVQADIRVDGVSISRPFGIDLPWTISAEVGDARIVAGYGLEGDSSITYYNRGLTLLEERPGPFPGVHVKLSSPELEHTMTRDNVLRDEGYEKVLGHARAQVEGPLRTRLLEVLAEQAQASAIHRRGDAADTLMGHFLRHLLRHLQAGESLPRAAWSAPIVRCHHAGAVDLTTLRKAAKARRVYWADAASPLTQALHDRGDLVIAAEGEPRPGLTEPAGTARVCALPELLAGRTAPRVHAVLCTSLPVADPPNWARLRPALAALLAEVGPRPRAIAAGDLCYPGSPVAERVAIAQDNIGAVTAVDALELVPGRRLIVHINHPAVGSALALAQHEPEFAAYKLAKLVVLEHGRGLTVEVDHTLATKALELRWQRMT